LNDSTLVMGLVSSVLCEQSYNPNPKIARMKSKRQLVSAGFALELMEPVFSIPTIPFTISMCRREEEKERLCFFSFSGDFGRDLNVTPEFSKFRNYDVVQQLATEFQDDLVNEVLKLVKYYSPSHIVFGGHSRGGAIASLCGFALKQIKVNIPVFVFSFGSLPLVGTSNLDDDSQTAFVIDGDPVPFSNFHLFPAGRLIKLDSTSDDPAANHLISSYISSIQYEVELSKARKKSAWKDSKKRFNLGFPTASSPPRPGPHFSSSIRNPKFGQGNEQLIVV
jgi:hypothetical protein